ncbi:GIN domain-containing protein [Massilia glaciei]|uniref:DUF2807 domain-containing protein n=1 Tax=Massilia glaciei TaxID=1524097 RepID=A0A2U2I605_9BURK|nr:DUF2807 domain-containing protein [Massilia glaciei]PWF55197.1 DUF2807 domain-containing protein [Massilia glaciei]
MNKVFCTAVFAATFAAGSAAAIASDTLSEARAVDARAIKVKLGGVINLRMKQGHAPSLVLYGDKETLAKVSVSQQGDTLQIDTGRGGGFRWGRGKPELRAELTLPNMSELASHGVGSAEVSGFSGERIKLTLDGAGAITHTGSYKHIDANLGGVGSMTLNAGASERIELDLQGAGRIAINGNSKMLHATMGGVGSLNAQQLRADAVELNMTGLGSATVYAKNSANLSLNGLGSATVYGKPAARNASARGLGSVSWQ